MLEPGTRMPLESGTGTAAIGYSNMLRLKPGTTSITATSLCCGCLAFQEPVTQRLSTFIHLYLTPIGKTVLASRIIDECHSVAHIRTTFFYCQHTDDERNAFVAVARTMLSQLVVGNDLLLQLIYERATKSSEASLTSIQTAKELLDTALKTYDKTRKTYIVIDGLDEYDREDRKEISAWFKEQVRNVPTKDLGQLRCLFISQDDGYARKDMSDCSSLKLKVELTHHDIEAYCKMWHQRIEERFKALDPKEHNISEMVTARAQGITYTVRPRQALTY
jgi:hypothetical protein